MMKAFALFALVSLACSSPCPYGQLAESGQLNKRAADNFYLARARGESAVEEQMEAHMKEKREAEHAKQAMYYKRQLEARQLPLGGGLLNGVLQPFTGVLANLDVPTPQPTGLAILPGPGHKYIAPKKSDVRGMCPTLNTMANHGYISRNGISTFAQAANACQITLGFGYDTCVFLSALGLLAGGDLPSGIYSIGGADSRVPNTLGPSLGISKHGFFEVDNSITREDSYFGNQANFKLARFQELTKIAKKYGGQYGNEAFAQERVLRYKQSRASNPQFDAGVRWLAVTTAERVFIPAAMPNGTHQKNSDYRNVSPFWLDETFPDNWFRRATPYSLADTGTDIATLLASSPEVTVPGQNEGLDNFVPAGIDLSNVTPSEATCFLATAIFDETPGFLAPGLVKNWEIASAFLNGAVKPFFAQYNCPVTEFTKPGPDAGNKAKGPDVGPCNDLVDGHYRCK